MLIRYGYEMTFVCSAPTPMVCQLDVHPSSSVVIFALEKAREDSSARLEA